MASRARLGAGGEMASMAQSRLLVERSIERGIAAAKNEPRHSARSVTFNLTESPLGWLFTRGFVTQRQFDAGERLRWDWERAHLAPRVTMAWDSAPVARGRGGLCPIPIRAALNSTPGIGSMPPSPRPGPDWLISCGGWCAPAMACATPRPRSAGLPGRAS